MSSAKKSQSQAFRYKALKFAQRSDKKAPHFMIFHAAAGEIAQWADVDRLEPNNPVGAQRPLRALKVKKVAGYFSADARNTIPTAVVIALNEGALEFNSKPDPDGDATAEFGTLTIKIDKGKPGLIIDGQHRVFGAEKFGGGTRLSVVAFLGDDEAERAFQFVVINNTASKVSRDHIKALNLQYDPDKLNKRLIDSAGVSLGIAVDKYEDLEILDAKAPFKGLIDWPTNTNGYVASTALESGLSETRDKAALLGIEGLELDIFLQIWSEIKKRYKDIWAPYDPKSTKSSRLLTKVAIYALTTFILDNMLSTQRSSDTPIDFADGDELEKLVQRVTTRIEPEFWTADWTITELDTASGRQRLVEALQIIESNKRFGRPWYDKVPFIDPALLHGQSYATKPKKSTVNAKKVKAKN